MADGLGALLNEPLGYYDPTIANGPWGASDPVADMGALLRSQPMQDFGSGLASGWGGEPGLGGTQPYSSGRAGYALGMKGKSLVDSLTSAFTAPGEAWRGEIAPEDMPTRALDTASWMTMPGLGRAALAAPAENALGMAGGKLASGAASATGREAERLAAHEGAATSAGQEAASPSITAYHGSPYDFDRFDMSKIGTGEGAQAFGHGLYFAGNEDVAKGYRGQIRANWNHPHTIAQSALDRFAGDRQQAADEMAGTLESIKQWHAQKPTPTTAEGRAYFKGQEDLNVNAQLAIDLLRSGADIIEPPSPGHMYQVQINANPDHFLDWDKPLSEQSPPVKEKLRSIGLDVDAPDFVDRLRQAAGTRLLQNDSGVHPFPRELPRFGSPEAAQAMRDAGIPGIKYLDAGSRTSGDGTRNYVTFSDDIVNILRKYGLAGLGIGTGSGLASFKLQPVDHDPFATDAPVRAAQVPIY